MKSTLAPLALCLAACSSVSPAGGNDGGSPVEPAPSIAPDAAAEDETDPRQRAKAIVDWILKENREKRLWPEFGREWTRSAMILRIRPRPSGSYEPAEIDGLRLMLPRSWRATDFKWVKHIAARYEILSPDGTVAGLVQFNRLGDSKDVVGPDEILLGGRNAEIRPARVVDLEVHGARTDPLDPAELDGDRLRLSFQVVIRSGGKRWLLAVSGVALPMVDQLPAIRCVVDSIVCEH